jgi:hypothetical protein
MGDSSAHLIGLGHACHRPGIHEGRLRVTGKAGDLTWTIGRDPIMIVDGREKVNLRD